MAIPGGRCLRESSGKVSNEPTVPVSLLCKPFPAERLLGNPVEDVGVHGGAARLHKIASETVSCRCVHVQDAKTWIKAQSGCGNFLRRCSPCEARVIYALHPEPWMGPSAKERFVQVHGGVAQLGWVCESFLVTTIRPVVRPAR